MACIVEIHCDEARWCCIARRERVQRVDEDRESIQWLRRHWHDCDSLNKSSRRTIKFHNQHSIFATNFIALNTYLAPTRARTHALRSVVSNICRETIFIDLRDCQAWKSRSRILVANLFQDSWTLHRDYIWNTLAPWANVRLRAICLPARNMSTMNKGVPQTCGQMHVCELTAIETRFSLNS